MIILNNYSLLITYFLTVFIIAIIMVIVPWLLQNEKYKNNKLNAYECGFEPFDDAQMSLNINFFIIIILFLIFDLEILFVIPWFSCINSQASCSEILTLIFVLYIITAGFVYEWLSKILHWSFSYTAFYKASFKKNYALRLALTTPSIIINEENLIWIPLHPSQDYLGLYYTGLTLIVTGFLFLFKKHHLFTLIIALEALLFGVQLLFIYTFLLTQSITAVICLFFILALAVCESVIFLTLLVLLLKKAKDSSFSKLITQIL